MSVTDITQIWTDLYLNFQIKNIYDFSLDTLGSHIILFFSSVGGTWNMLIALPAQG